MLITADQVREHHPSLAGSTSDALLDSLIPRADALMAAYCGFPLPTSGGRTLQVASYTWYLDGPDDSEPRLLRLPVRPLVTVSVYQDPTWTWAASTLVDSSWYTAVLPAGELMAIGTSPLGAWMSARRALKATATAGYSTSPPDLVLAAATAVRHLADRAIGGEDYASASSSRQSSTRSESTHILPPTVRAILDDGYTLWSSRAG